MKEAAMNPLDHNTPASEGESAPGKAKPKGWATRLTVPLDRLVILTIPQAWELCRSMGHNQSRRRIDQAIRLGHLPAYIDGYRKDRLGQPRLFIYRKDLDDWLNNMLRPYGKPANTIGQVRLLKAR